MKRFLFALIVLAVSVSGIQAQETQKEKDKAAKKAAEEQKKEQRKAAEALQNQISFVDAVQAINDQSFVIEANNIQTKTGRMFFVTPSTNFVSLHNGQANVQIANSSSVYPGPNGLGGITVQGSASGVKITQDDKGNVWLNMSVQGIFISATVSVQLWVDSNNATVIVDPNFSGNTLTMSGQLFPSSMSNVFQGSTL